MPTHVLGIVATKGGTSKSTLASALAVRAAKGGRQVVLLDADPQGSLLKWWKHRGEAPGTLPVRAVPGLAQDQDGGVEGREPGAVAVVRGELATKLPPRDERIKNFALPDVPQHVFLAVGQPNDHGTEK